MAKKSWTQSRTVAIGALQAIVGLLSGVLLLLQSGVTPEALMAIAVGIKGVLDILLRFKTVQAIE